MDSNKNQRINTAGMHEEIISNKDIRTEWNNGSVPKFPFYHGINTLGKIHLLINFDFILVNAI